MNVGQLWHSNSLPQEPLKERPSISWAQFKDIVPENPRVMKRMLNAFAMRQAIGILERNTVPVDVLARWTILEQRFPALADLLIEHPEWTEILTRKVAADERERLPLLLPFLDLQIIQNLVGKTGDSRCDRCQCAGDHARIGELDQTDRTASV